MLTTFQALVILQVSQKCGFADVAQLAEQLICNQQVKGSSPFVSSSLRTGTLSVPVLHRLQCEGAVRVARSDGYGGVPERSMGADCKSAGERLRRFESFPHHGRTGVARRWLETGSAAGVAQLVEHQPSKLRVAGSSPVARFALA